MKMLKVFRRDLAAAARNPVALWLILAPIALSLILRAAMPGIVDSPLRFAMLRGDDPARIEFMERCAAVELFDDESHMRERVLARDDAVAIPPSAAGGEADLYVQGDESEAVIAAARALIARWEAGLTEPSEGVELRDFGIQAPPMKATLVAMLTVLVTILSGMLIAMSIVEEKTDGTIRAIRVTPISPTAFAAGKCLIGAAMSLIASAAILWVSGLNGVDYGKILTASACASLVSFSVGFLAGLNSDDFITAMANMKLLMIPAIAPIVAIETVRADLQWLFYWSPFYWAYDAVKGALTQTAGWDRIARDAGLTAAIALILYLAMRGKLREKLR